MKKFFKILVVLLVLSGVSYGGYFSYNYYLGKKDIKNIDDVNKFNKNLSIEVTRQDMISSLNFIGNTKIKNEQKLKFNTQAKVIGVYKKVGEKVSKGDLIAEIDKQSVLSQIEILKLGLENANLKLKKLRENNSAIDIKKQELEIQNLKDDYQNKQDNLAYFKKDGENKIKDLERSLTQKNLEYKLLEKELGTNINQIKRSPEEKLQALDESKNKLKTLQEEYKRDNDNLAINLQKKQNEYYNSIEKEYLDIKNNIGTLNRTFQEFDKLLKFRPVQINSTNYDYFYSGKDLNYKNQSTSYFLKAYSVYTKLEKQFDAIQDKYDIDSIVYTIQTEKEMYGLLQSAADYTMKGLNNSIETDDFNSSVISSYFSAATSLYTDANSKISSLKDVPINLKTLKTPEEIKTDMENDISAKKDAISSLEISIKKQQDEYDYNLSTIDDKENQEKDKLTDKKKEIDDVILTLEKTRKNNVFDLNTKYKELSSAEVAINESQKKLKDLTDTKNNQEISLAENDVKQAQISLNNEIAKLGSYELKAPFDGVITKNDYLVGDNLTSDDQKSISIENPDILEISIFADQVDITKLSKGQKAIVTYDSFPGVEFSGEIIDIDSTPQDKDGVTKYEVKVFMTKQEQKIFSGMSAYVNIVTKENLGVLAVPFSAIKTDQNSGEEYVVVLGNNGKKEKRKVKSGYSDGTNTEILEGLKEGEKVLEIDYDSNYYKPEDFENSGGGVMMGAG